MWLVTAFAALVLFLLIYSATTFTFIENRNRPRGEFVRAGGVDLHYLKMGPRHPVGAPIVLIHGASGNLGDMAESLMPRLAERFTVYAFDRPGHGWSGRPDRPDITDPAAQAALLHEAMTVLGVTRPVLLGHSWGGAVATAYALSFPDALSGLLVLAGATHVWEGKTAWYHTLVRKRFIGHLFLNTLMPLGGQLLAAAGVTGNFAPNTPPPDYARRIGLSLLFRPANFRANSADSSNLRSYLKTQSLRYEEIKVPTIIITGNRDKTVWAKLHSYALHEQIAGSEMIKLVGVGHMPHYVRPDLVEEALSRLALGMAVQAGTHIVEPVASSDED
tara:strand:+ start:6290 stop:7285 length:996 start_codon:yes stop_codon:yes gene_type:complete